MIDVPVVKWRADLGGRLNSSQFVVADVDLDGSSEVVLLRGGRMVARRPSGTLVWVTEPLGLDTILAAEDLDADGRIEVVGVSTWDGVLVVGGGTGTVLWRTPTDLPIASVISLDPDGDGRYSVYVADRGCSNSGVGTARVYSFPAGFSGAVSTVTLDVSGHGYWCGMDQAFGDLDADGTDELLALSDDRVIAYDPATGLPVDATASLGDFPWGRGKTYAADVDADGRDEVLVATDNIAGTYTDTRRLLLVEDNGAGLMLRWAARTDAVNGAHRFPQPPIAHLASGSALQVVTSFYEPASSAWRLVVIDGASSSPTPIASVDGQVALAVADVDGDGFDEVLSQDATVVAPPSFSTIRAWKLLGTTLTEVWSVADASLPRPAMPWGATFSAVVLPPAEPAGVATAVMLDSTGDLRADGLRLVGPSGTVLASRAWGDAVPGIDVRPSPAGGTPLFATRGDGTIELLGPALGLLNDAVAPLGSADLLERSLAPGQAGLEVIAGTTGSSLVVGDSTDHVVVFDLTRVDAVSGPAVQWRGTDRIMPVIVHASIPDDSGSCRLSYVTDSSPTLALVCQTLGTGAESARFSFPDSSRLYPYWGLTPLAGPAPGLGLVAVPTYEAGTGFISYSTLDLDAGTTRAMDISHLAASGGDGPGSAWDADADGQDDFCATVYADIRMVDGTTGTTIGGGPSLYDGTAAFDDLDGDTLVDLLHNGAVLGGPARLTTAFATVWAADPGAWHNRGAAAPTSTGTTNVGTSRYASPRFQIYRGSDGGPVVDEVLAGGRAWTDALSAIAAGANPGELSDVTAAADLLGLGRGSFLVGSTDGFLYAVSADDGTLDWVLDLRAVVGEPIAADIDDDGLSEVVVAVGDGSVYAIDREELSAPRAVFDTDGTYLALSDADELDELDSSTTAGANWAAVTGASGSEYALLTADDTFVVPWTDAAAATRVVLSDLNLQTDIRYHFAVRAYATDGSGDVRRSGEALSDGFVVIDSDPPTGTLSVTPSVIRPLEPPPGAAADIVVDLADAVALRSWRLAVAATDGTEVIVLADAAIGGTSFASTLTWDGTDSTGTIVATGDYTVNLHGDDAGGFVFNASAPILVCAAEAEPRCSVTDADADAPGDADADGDADAEVGPDGLPDGAPDAPGDGTASDVSWSSQGGGMGCSCAVPASSAGSRLFLFAAVLGPLFGGVLRRACRRRD